MKSYFSNTDYNLSINILRYTKPSTTICTNLY